MGQGRTVITARRARRDMARGQVESALKVLSGSQAGLPATFWRHGLADLDRSRIRFRRRLWQFARAPTVYLCSSDRSGLPPCPRGDPSAEGDVVCHARAEPG